jgi:two-component system OmpR family sensor kinase
VSLRRFSIRLRLTAAFAAATTLVLAGAGLFVYLRLSADFDDSIDATLRARWTAAAQMYAGSGTVSGFPLEDADEGFVQVVDRSGTVRDHAGLVYASPLHVDELDRAFRERVWIQRPVPGVDGQARILAGPAPGTDVAVVVGQSQANRDEALADLRRSFLAGGPVAILVAALFGYWLARAGFAPVEAMRRGAAEISLTGSGGRRLPIPATRDEIQRLAETLNEMIERLEHSFERERRFVADASHELRTPIAVIKTELEAALLVGGHHPQVAQSQRAAVDECDSLTQLAEDLLVIARTTETGVPLAKEPVKLRRLLHDTRHRFIDRATRHGQAINIDLTEDLDVVADPVRIRQALANLVDNALRHGRGTITLRGRANGATVHFDVVDEGPGFGPDITGRAFERFARGEHARGRSGAGLGLPIVRTLATAHGGTAEILPAAPTTVRINLPR